MVVRYQFILSKFRIIFIDRSISAKACQYLDLLIGYLGGPIALRLFKVHVINVVIAINAVKQNSFFSGRDYKNTLRNHEYYH